MNDDKHTILQDEKNISNKKLSCICYKLIKWYLNNVIMKCPKKFDTLMRQQKLSEFLPHKKRSNSEVNTDSDSNEESQAMKFKCPKLSPVKNKSNVITTGSQSAKVENSSDDGVIESSQDTHKSKLKNRADGTLERKSKTPQSTPCKLNNVQLPDSTNKKLSFSEICEVSSTVIKDEIGELLNDMKDFESIEMMHNLSDLLVESPTSLNILDCTSPMGHVVKIESFTEDEDINTRNNQLQDPLQIGDEDTKVKHKNLVLTKKEKKIIDKHKLKDILPSPKNLTNKNKRKSHQIVDENESVNKSSKLQNHKTKKADCEGNALSEKLLKVLKTLTVKLQHEVPPQHMIENSAGARALDEEQVAQFEKYGPLKRGPYTKGEDETIKKNWEEFCDVHGWDEKIVEPFLYMRHEGKYYIPDIEERKNFVRFLANGLSWRSLYSVYYRFRNIYCSNVKNGPYTATEDKKILSYMRKAPSVGIDNKCAELAKLLKRKRQSIWNRYQKLKTCYNLNTTDIERERKEKEKSKSKKHRKLNRVSFQKSVSKQIFTDIQWTSPLVKKFLDCIIDIFACEELVELKNQIIETRVWKEMEKKLCIDRAVLQNFWYLQLHMQLFCPTPIYLNDTKVQLIEHMHTENFKNLEEIDWENLSTHFRGITPLFLSKLFDQLMNHAKRATEGSSLSDALEYLHTKYVPILNDKSIDAVLPKLFYHGGKIICIDKGSEKKIPNKFTTNPFYDDDENNM